MRYSTRKMFATISTLSSLLVTVVTAHRFVSQSDTTPPSNLELPKRPISYSPPSQYPIITYQPRPDEPSLTSSTINIRSGLLEQPIPVTFSLSTHICMPLVSAIPYIISDIFQHLLSKYLDGVLFPVSSDQQMSPLPVYLGANITEQLYRSKFVVSLALKLSPLRDDLKRIETPKWRLIVRSIEESAQELDRGARRINGAGLGDMLVLEVNTEEINVLAEWRLWKVIDGLAVICHDL